MADVVARRREARRRRILDNAEERKRKIFGTTKITDSQVSAVCEDPPLPTLIRREEQEEAVCEALDTTPTHQPACPSEAKGEDAGPPATTERHSSTLLPPTGPPAKTERHSSTLLPPTGPPAKTERHSSTLLPPAGPPATTERHSSTLLPPAGPPTTTERHSSTLLPPAGPPTTTERHSSTLLPPAGPPTTTERHSSTLLPSAGPPATTERHSSTLLPPGPRVLNGTVPGSTEQLFNLTRLPAPNGSAGVPGVEGVAAAAAQSMVAPVLLALAVCGVLWFGLGYVVSNSIAFPFLVWESHSLWCRWQAFHSASRGRSGLIVVALMLCGMNQATVSTYVVIVHMIKCFLEDFSLYIFTVVMWSSVVGLPSPVSGEPDNAFASEQVMHRSDNIDLDEF